MTKTVFRFVTLGTFMTILVAAPPLTPAFAMGGGGAGGTGSGGFPSSLLRLDAPDQPPSQRRPVHIKSTHKKKITRHSSIRQPGT